MYRDNAGHTVSDANRPWSQLAAALFVLAVIGLMGFARAAFADVDSAVTAFRDGDYETAAKELQAPAYNGNPAAQYYLGVMHAKGLGVAHSPADALKWFLCAEAGALSAPLKERALEWRHRLYADMSLLEMDYAEKSAASNCQVAEPLEAFEPSYRQHEVDEAIPQRSGLSRVVLFPGDVIMRGVLVVFDHLGSRVMIEAALKAIKGLGDILFGFLALLGWLLILRVGYLTVHHFWEAFLERLPFAFGTAGHPQQTQGRGRRPNQH